MALIHLTAINRSVYVKENTKFKDNIWFMTIIQFHFLASTDAEFGELLKVTSGSSTSLKVTRLQTGLDEGKYTW